MATSKKTAANDTSASEAKGTGMPNIPGMAEMSKLLGQFKLPGVDVSAILEAQRKDMEALAEANRQAYQGIQALAQRRTELLKESLGQWQAAMQEAAGKEALAKQTERARKGVQKAMDDFRELAEMEAKSRKQAWKVLQDRFEENLANVKKLLQPK
jgi:phasin family protein